MFIQTIQSLHPLNLLLGDFDLESLFSGLDITELIFGALNQVTFLVDILIAVVLLMAIFRGIFKKFWKVMWRGVIFLILLMVLFISVDSWLAATIANLPISLKGQINGVDVNYESLYWTVFNVIEKSGQTAEYSEALTQVTMKNLALFIGIPIISLLTPLVSAVTFPLINLAIPRKLRDIKLIPVKLAVSLSLAIIGILVFALPMATLVPPMTAIKDSIADNTLLKKFLNPEFIGFLELFTSEKSMLLKVITLGNNPSALNVYKSFTVNGTVYEIKDVLPAIFEELNDINFVPAPLIPVVTP